MHRLANRVIFGHFQLQLGTQLARLSYCYYIRNVNYHEGVDGALVRLLARRGMDDPDGLYLCGEGGSPGRLQSLDGVFLLPEFGDESQ